MNKLIIFLLLFSIPSYAFASDGIGGFAQDAVDTFEFFKFFITDGVPSFFTRLVAWVVEFYIYIKFMMYLETIKFAWSVAELILQDLSISENLASMFNSMPSSIRAFAFDCRIVDAINVVLNAYFTRIVLRIF